jgi:hypothetical protein
LNLKKNIKPLQQKIHNSLEFGRQNFQIFSFIFWAITLLFYQIEPFASGNVQVLIQADKWDYFKNPSHEFV